MDVEVSTKGLAIRLTAVFGWVVLVYLIQVIGHLTLASFFTQYTDPCNRFYESPNNVGGWTIAAIAVLIPTAIGVKLRKYVTLTWVILGMAIQIYLFTDVILGIGDC